MTRDETVNDKEDEKGDYEGLRALADQDDDRPVAELAIDVV
jgi:hypothetical protein